MMRLIQWLIFGHIHKWTTIQQGTITGRMGDGSSVGAIGDYHIQQCDHCGKVVKRRLV